MMVALSTVNALTKEGTGGTAREFVMIDNSIGDDGGDKVHFGIIGPESPLRNHVTNHLIVRTVLMELIAQPIPEAIAAKYNELPLIGTNQKASKSAGEIIRKSAICQQSFGPAIDPVGAVIRFKLANLFERRSGSVEHKRQSSHHGEILCAKGGWQPRRMPAIREKLVDTTDDQRVFG
jgi:hypothetical protein